MDDEAIDGKGGRGKERKQQSITLISRLSRFAGRMHPHKYIYPRCYRSKFQLLYTCSSSSYFAYALPWCSGSCPRYGKIKKKNPFVYTVGNRTGDEERCILSTMGKLSPRHICIKIPTTWRGEYTRWWENEYIYIYKHWPCQHHNLMVHRKPSVRAKRSIPWCLHRSYE